MQKKKKVLILVQNSNLSPEIIFTILEDVTLNNSPPRGKHLLTKKEKNCGHWGSAYATEKTPCPH